MRHPAVPCRPRTPGHHGAVQGHRDAARGRAERGRVHRQARCRLAVRVHARYHGRSQCALTRRAGAPRPAVPSAGTGSPRSSAAPRRRSVVQQDPVAVVTGGGEQPRGPARRSPEGCPGCPGRNPAATSSRAYSAIAGSTRSASVSSSRTPPAVTSVSKPVSHWWRRAPAAAVAGHQVDARPPTIARTVRDGGANVPGRDLSRISPLSPGGSPEPARGAAALPRTRRQDERDVEPRSPRRADPGTPSAVKGHPHTGRRHPGAHGGRQQGAQQEPVVHREVARDRSARHTCGPERRLGPARLPAGKEFDVATPASCSASRSRSARSPGSTATTNVPRVRRDGVGAGGDGRRRTPASGAATPSPARAPPPHRAASVTGASIPPATREAPDPGAGSCTVTGEAARAARQADSTR